MLLKIFSWFWVVTGVFFLIFPKLLRKRIQRKSKWKLRSLLFVVLFVWCAPLIAFFWEKPGVLSKSLLILGVLVLLKIIFSLTLKASEKLIAWSENRSPFIFRLYALFQIIMGFVLLHMIGR